MRYSYSSLEWNNVYFDVEFTGGITYSDVISLNLTFTFDPPGMVPRGTGRVNSTVVMSPICTLQRFPNPAGQVMNICICTKFFA